MLAVDGIRYDVRTIQRDLVKLSRLCPLASKERGKAKRWFWKEDGRVVDIPRMELPAALAFRLAEERLTPLLPKATLKHMRPYFRIAREIVTLSHRNRLREKKKVSGPISC